MGKERKLTGRLLICYCVMLYLLWGAMELLLLPAMEGTMGVWAEALTESAVKLLIWTLPALLLMRRFGEDLWLPLKKMFTAKVNWWPYLAIAAGFLLLRMINALSSMGKVGIHPEFEAASLVGAVLFVGVTEEVVFRAWLLGAALRKLGYRPAILTNAVLFVLIHFPIWIRTGLFEDPLNVLSGCAGIFCVSILLSWAFTKSRNLFVPIVLHMSWNLGIVVFLGG